MRGNRRAKLMSKNWIKAIQDRTKRVPVSGGRTYKLDRISFSDLTFLPSQLKSRPVNYFTEPISAKTVVGKQSNKPVELETPIAIAAMSFGALSREAKTALAKASTLAGTVENTGEGGVLPEERELAKHLTIQYSTGRFGLDDEVLKKADIIEIKIGQGAKGGQGGLLPKDKVTAEVAAIRKLPMGKDIHSPSSHADIKSIDDLKAKVAWLRRLSGGVPITIKLAASHVAEDVRLAVMADPDIIAIDGLEGGTGAAPEVMLNEVGLPAIAALSLARKTLDELGARQELWIGGGFTEGGDMAKALALGADAVFSGFSLLVAMGCAACNQCYTGKCPKGITTQDEALRKNLIVDEAAQNIANYIKNCTEEIKMAAGACGKTSVHDLSRGDLRAMTSDMAKIARVGFIAD